MSLTEREPIEPDIGTPEDWARIEHELGCKDFDPKRREGLWRDLALIFNLYSTPAELRLPRPRPSNYGRALEALKRHAVRLFADLSPSGQLPAPFNGKFQSILDGGRQICDPDALRADGLNDLDQWALAYLSRELLPFPRRQALLQDLAEVIAEADKLMRGLPQDKGGRRRDDDFQALMYELAGLYRQWSGKKPALSRRPPIGRRRGEPGGPFFRFVKACLQTFAPDRVKTEGEREDDGETPSAEKKRNEALAKTIRRVLSTKRWPPRAPIMDKTLP